MRRPFSVVGTVLFAFFPWTSKERQAHLQQGDRREDANHLDWNCFGTFFFLFFQPPSKVLLKDHKPQPGSSALKQTVHTQSAEGNTRVMRSMSD